MRRHPSRFAALTAAAALLATGCGAATGTGHKPATSTSPAAAGGGQTTVVAAGKPAIVHSGSWTVTLTPDAAPAGARLAIIPAAGTGPPSGPHLTPTGPPVSVTLSTGEPTGPVHLTQTLPAPVAAGATVQLATREGDGSWTPSPATVSTDRRTVTATVSRLSVKSFIVNTLNQLLSVRVDPPTCDGKPPGWAATPIYVDDRNAPLRYCAGHDPHDSTILVVKLRTNRIYGVDVTPNVTPAWVYNNTFAGAGPEDVITRTFAEVLNGPDSSQFVPGGGAELDIGFRESDVRAAGGGTLVTASANLSPALAGMIYELSTGQLEDSSNPTARFALGVTSVVSIAQCVHDVATAGISQALTELFACGAQHYTDIATAAAGILVRVLPDEEPTKLGDLAGTAGRLLKYLFLAQVSYQAAEYIADIRGRKEVFQVVDFPTIIIPPKTFTLSLDGLGPIHLGDTPQQAAARLGVPAHKSTGDLPGCDSWYFRVRGIDIYLLLDASGKIRDITYDEPLTVHTPSGIGIGSSMTQLQAAYAGHLSSQPASDSNATEWIYTPTDPSLADRRLTFAVQYGKVVKMTVTRTDQPLFTCYD